MENSAKALSFPNWARLTRDKNNYHTWQKHIFDVLQAIGCDQAIRSDFASLTYESDDVSSSDDDSDGIDFSRLDFSGLDLRGVGRERHFPQPSPTPSQEQLQEQRMKQMRDSLQQAVKKEKKEKKEKKKLEPKDPRFGIRPGSKKYIIFYNVYAEKSEAWTRRQVTKAFPEINKKTFRIAYKKALTSYNEFKKKK